MRGSSRRLAESLETERAFEAGELIVAEGDRGTEMFVIQSGRVCIFRMIGGREVEASVLGRGDFFGEMSLLESLPRDASARAVEPTRLLVIGPGGLLVRLRRDPTFALEMLHQLSGRVRTLNSQLGAAPE